MENVITYEQIAKVNEGMTGIDVKGKSYVMVPERIKAFRKLFPDGFIKTDIISLENGVCVMQTRVGYYRDGNEVVLGTGLAYEKESNGYINKTSYIENCETSSVGRALGFLALGIDGGGVCSAEELANAISNQTNTKATVTVSSKVFDYRPVFARIKAKLNMNDRDFANLRKELIAKGVVKDIPGADLDENGWNELEREMVKAKGSDDGISGQTE